MVLQFVLALCLKNRIPTLYRHCYCCLGIPYHFLTFYWYTDRTFCIHMAIQLKYLVFHTNLFGYSLAKIIRIER